jgi:protein-disulfide isomerase
MSGWLSLYALLIGCVFGIGCQPPGANDASQAAAAADGLPGVDTNSLTRAERDLWAELVTEQLAPCREVAKSIAECVRQNAACPACKPAAELLAQQIRRGKTKTQAEKAFRARFTQSGLVNVELDGSPSKGPANAPITIVEWADFECGFCAKAAPVLDEVQKAYPQQIRLVFKQFPLAMHIHAEQMARLVIAAGNQGKFWEMHAALFAAQGASLDEPAIRKLADGLKLDADKLLADVQAPETAERIARDRAHADKLGLKGTPFLVINARRFDFDLFDLEEDLRPWIDIELLLTQQGTPTP